MAEAADAPPHTTLRDPSGSRIITSDIKTGDIRYEIETDGGEVKFEKSGLIYGSTNEQHYVINDGNPCSAKAEYRAKFSFSRGEWKANTESELIVTCDEEHFFLRGRISAYEDDAQVFVKNWDIKIPRVVY